MIWKFSVVLSWSKRNRNCSRYNVNNMIWQKDYNFKTEEPRKANFVSILTTNFLPEAASLEANVQHTATVKKIQQHFTKWCSTTYLLAMTAALGKSLLLSLECLQTTFSTANVLLLHIFLKWWSLLHFAPKAGHSALLTLVGEFFPCPLVPQ